MFFTKRLNKLEIDVMSNRQMILAVNGMVRDIYDIFEKTGLYRKFEKINGNQHFSCFLANEEIMDLKKRLVELGEKIRSTKPVARKK